MLIVLILFGAVCLGYKMVAGKSLAPESSLVVFFASIITCGLAALLFAIDSDLSGVFLLILPIIIWIAVVIISKYEKVEDPHYYHTVETDIEKIHKKLETAGYNVCKQDVFSMYKGRFSPFVHPDQEIDCDIVYRAVCEQATETLFYVIKNYWNMVSRRVKFEDLPLDDRISGINKAEKYLKCVLTDYLLRQRNLMYYRSNRNPQTIDPEDEYVKRIISLLKK